MLPHCQQYPKHYLKNVPTTIKQKKPLYKQDVTVYNHWYTPEESLEYFGVDLPAKGYRPVQIRIENRSPDTYYFRPENLNVELAKPKEVARLLHHNTSLISGGLVACGYLGFQLFAPLTPCLFYAAPTAWKLHKDNQAVNARTKKLCYNTASEIKIPPYSSIDKFAFVKSSDFYGDCRLTLYNQDARKPIKFNISC